MIKKGNCLELLKELDDDSVDITITSPPYNMNLRIRYGKYLFRSEDSKISTKYKSNFDDKLTMDQYYDFHIEVLRELIRVSNLVFYNVQFLTGNKRALFRIMGDLNEQLKEVIIWNKVIAQPAMQPQVLNSQYENILVFEKDNAISRQFTNAPFDRGTVSNVWDIRREPSYDKKHKATFPKELVSTILQHFATEGNTILDPFMGLGTTGVVALENNMKFVGFELDDYYYSVAKKRLNELGHK